MAPTSLAALALVMMSTIGALPVKPGRAVFLGISRQPEEIANLLVDVQDVWKLLFASCDPVDNSTSTVDCRQAPIAFARSCETVVQAVTEGTSGGDGDVVEEYMKDICGQDVLKGWRQDRCTFLASTIVGAMSFKTWAKNGVLLDKKKTKVCADLWSKFSSDEQVQRDGERKRAAAMAAEVAMRKAEELKTELDAFGWALMRSHDRTPRPKPWMANVKAKAAKERADIMGKADTVDAKDLVTTKPEVPTAKADSDVPQWVLATKHKLRTPKANVSAKTMTNVSAKPMANVSAKPLANVSAKPRVNTTNVSSAN